jgi:hypothetical protein
MVLKQLFLGEKNKRWRYFYMFARKIREKIQWGGIRGQNQIETLLAQNGRILSNQQTIEPNKLIDIEFKVFSQWGEDGIIQWLVKTLPIENETFIEFGVADYQEANTRFLLMNNNWSGMIIDGSKENMDSVKRSSLYWRYNLLAKDAFITRENINGLLALSGFEEDLGLLSVDIDGNDYWVLEAIEGFRPRILICEFNPTYGYEKKVTIPYGASFYRTNAHYSNLYFGASLQAIKSLAERKGYCFIGTNLNANDAFFVRADLAQYIPEPIRNNPILHEVRSRESRDKDGNLTYISSAREKLELIADKTVVDLDSEPYLEKTIREVFGL